MLNNFDKKRFTPFHFAVLVSVLTLVLYHKPLLQFALATLAEQSANTASVMVTLIVVVFMLTFALIAAVSLVSIRLAKALTACLMILNATALYFIVTYHVILDRTMIGNILNTRFSEAEAYGDWNLLVYIVLLGVIPGIAISLIKVHRLPRIRFAALSVAVIVLCAAILYANSGAWLWIDKHAKQLGGHTLPWSYVGNGIRHYVTLQNKSRSYAMLPDAVMAPGKSIVVLVVGETARSQNFSVYGYERETNPNVSQLGIKRYDAEACSTYTTASLSCMLSYSKADGEEFEPLPTYLERNGVAVLWQSRNWGEPRLDIANYKKASDLRPFCTRPDCDFDGVLLTGLKDYIESSTQDKIFVVLHTKGSHGPTYFKQYPARFEKFTPVCKSANPNECSKEELLNAYDNSILYTDFLISETIKLLDDVTTHDSTLIYMSDHGESLGEYGLYLHGTPMLLAPDYQKRVPLLLWQATSRSQGSGARVAGDCETDGERVYDQFVVFHTVLGALGIESPIYQSDRDLSKC